MKNLSLVFALGCVLVAAPVMADVVVPAAVPVEAVNVEPIKEQSAEAESLASQTPQVVTNLAEALAAAYVNNAGLQSLRQKVIAGHEKSAQAKAGFLPTITSTVSMQGNKQIFSGSQKDSSVYSPSSTRTSTRAGGVTIKQNLFAGGSTVAAVAFADQTIRSSWAELLSKEQETFFNIIKSYLDLINKISKVTVYKANHAALKKSYETEYEKHKIGEGALTQVALAESKLAGAEAELCKGEAEVVAEKAGLSAIVGAEIGNIKKPEAPANLPHVLPVAISLAIDNNPDVIKAQFDHRAAEADIDKNNDQLLPSIDLQAGSQRNEASSRTLNPAMPTTGQPLSGPDVRASNNYTNNSVTLSMNYELYSGGRYSSRKRELHDTFISKRMEIEAVKAKIVGGMKSTFESYQAAKMNIENYKKQVKAQEVAVEATRQEMEVGTKVLFDVLTAQTDLVKAQLGVIDAETDYFKSAFQMVSLLGGLHAKAMMLSVNYFDPKTHYDNITVGF